MSDLQPGDKVAVKMAFRFSLPLGIADVVNGIHHPVRKITPGTALWIDHTGQDSVTCVDVDGKLVTTSMSNLEAWER